MPKKQFSLGIISVIYIARLYKTWQLYNDDPRIEYRWAFDSLRITTNETVDWLVEVVNKISDNEK